MAFNNLILKQKFKAEVIKIYIFYVVQNLNMQYLFLCLMKLFAQ
jgi:hypothetical protein